MKLNYCVITLCVSREYSATAQDMREVRSAAAGVAPVSTSTRALCGWGSRLKEGGTLAPLSAATLLKAYRSSGRRVILLGLDGTLIQQEKVLVHLKAFHDFQARDQIEIEWRAATRLHRSVHGITP